MRITIPVPDPGEGTKLRPEEPKNIFFCRPGSPLFIRVWMTPPPPPHLKVWTRQCILSLKTPQMGVTLGVQAVNLILKLYNMS